MNLTDEWKRFLIETSQQIKGSERRLFMARTVRILGTGGQRKAERELGWSRTTIRKGMHELESGFRCEDAYSLRGRQKAEAYLPDLLTDIQEIVDGQSQTDPSFKSIRLYTRISAAEVRRQLVAQKGYQENELPQRRSINDKLRDLGYRPKGIAKCRPQKKIPETDAIFEQLAKVNPEADVASDTLRISLDAKAPIKIGPFSRRGKSRVAVKASDHDFKPKAILNLVAILLPGVDELFFYFVVSKVTSDFIVDMLERWWTNVKERFSQIKTLVINLDNGPENHSRRTQFMKRLLLFAQEHQINIQLAYYPPYHSKYNPVERSFGVLENHWNGALLDEIDTALNFAKTMTWNGNHPTVDLITKTYQTGVKLTAKAMRSLETCIQRLVGLEKWFVSIPWLAACLWDN